jgi:16S rRNA (uracil1498-N3)-methyltransferase
MGKHIFRFLGQRCNDEIWKIDEEDTFHLRKVLKLVTGNLVEVTDGNGSWITGRLSGYEGNQATAEIIHQYSDPPHERKMIMVLGATKPKTMDDTLPSLVELGVDQILVFQHAGSESFRINDKVVERWRRLVKESIKQCKRSWLVDILVFDDIAKLLKDAAMVSLTNRIYCDPDEASQVDNVTSQYGDVALVIGNEHGLQPQEVQELKLSGFKGVKISDGILTAYTAAIAAAGIWGAKLRV